MDLVEDTPEEWKYEDKLIEKLPQLIEEKKHTDGTKNEEIDEILEFLLSTAKTAQSEETGEESMKSIMIYPEKTLEVTGEESMKSIKIYPEETPLEGIRLRIHSSEQEEPNNY